MHKKNAFTLAEVLITLTIIGVIAALTIPTLLQKHKEKETITKLKKFYSTVSNAYELARTEDGSDPTEWVNAYNEPITDKIFEKMNVIKKCKGSDTSCIPNPNATYKTLNSSVNWPEKNLTWHIGTLDRRYVLADGTIVKSVYEGNCKTVRGTTEELKQVCNTVVIDLNGAQGPNQLGIDTFFFNVTPHSIVPFGSKEDTDSPINKRCNRNKTDAYNGLGCTWWAIYKDNMDYLTKTISWN